MINMKFRYILLNAVFALFSISNSVSQIPDSLEGKVNMLASSVGENATSKAYFIKLGPEVVPIVTQKLLQSLAEGSSPEGAQEVVFMQMPPADQKRLSYQVGLIVMQGAALENMPLPPDVRQAALNSIYLALKSLYPSSRKRALYSAAYGVGSEAIDYIIPLLNDPEISNRYTAAKMLAKVGDASTSEKIEKVLEERRQGLTVEQIEKDGSFQIAYDAINALNNKASPTPSPTVPKAMPKPSITVPSPKPIATPPPEPAATPVEAKPVSRFPIVPVAIIAAAIMGVIAFLLRRKSR